MMPCACGAPGYRELCGNGYCVEHYAAIVMTFDPSSFPSEGRGLPGRTDDPDDLTCATCKATWSGTVGESCAYCVRWAELACQWQVDDLLTMPDVDVESDQFDQKMTAWAKRLRRAVDNEIITDLRAQGALKAAAKHTQQTREWRTQLRTGRKAS